MRLVKETYAIAGDEIRFKPLQEPYFIVGQNYKDLHDVASIFSVGLIVCAFLSVINQGPINCARRIEYWRGLKFSKQGPTPMRLEIVHQNG